MFGNQNPVRQGAATESTRQARDVSAAERRRRQSELLDEGLIETFPASDPVSVVRL